MDARDYIHRQIAAARRLSDGIIKETTDEQFNWAPPGTVNPIGATLVHMLAAEDRFIQMALLGAPTLWERGGWSEKIGLTAPPWPRG